MQNCHVHSIFAAGPNSKNKFSLLFQWKMTTFKSCWEKVPVWRVCAPVACLQNLSLDLKTYCNCGEKSSSSQIKRICGSFAICNENVLHSKTSALLLSSRCCLRSKVDHNQNNWKTSSQSLKFKNYVFDRTILKKCKWVFPDFLYYLSAAYQRIPLYVLL